MTDPRIGEAITALTARLTTWQVDDAHTKASEYVNDMLRHGWRPRALAVETPEPIVRPSDPETAKRHIAEIRRLLRPTAEEPA